MFNSPATDGPEASFLASWRFGSPKNYRNINKAKMERAHLKILNEECNILNNTFILNFVHCW